MLKPIYKRILIFIIAFIVIIIPNCARAEVFFPRIDRYKIKKVYNSKSTQKELKELMLNMTKTECKFIKSIKYVTEKKIINSGRYLYFKVKFKANLLPAGAQPFMGYLIIPSGISEENQYAHYLILTEIRFIKPKASTDEYFFAGLLEDRSMRSLFYIFDLSNNNLKCIFETNECIYSYDSGECSTYQSGYLKLQNVDIDKDGFLDLRFTGIENHYCRGGEIVGYEKIKKPFKKNKIDLVYLYKPKLHSWIRQKSIFCPASENIYNKNGN